MKKKPSPPRLPPLSLEALNQVEILEKYARGVVKESSDPFRMNSNTESLSRSLRTCAVQLLAVQFEFYDSLPKYQHEWELPIAQSTLNSLLGAFPPSVSSDRYRPELVRTINDYLKERFEQSQVEVEAQEPKQVSRKELRDSYFAAFPEVKILDVCWAADQRYREWKRWSKNEVKDSSMPDLAFRRVLTSGKRPRELKKKSRPPGWQ